MTNKEQLAKDLLSAFNDFQSNAPTPGGSEDANKYVADKLADAIADGIERGARISFKGAKSAVEINSLPPDQKQAGDMYLCTTSGRLNGKTPLDVSENTAVIWDGESWSKFIEIDLSNYYTKAETDAHIAAAVATETALRVAADDAIGSRIDGLENIYETKVDAKDKAETYGLEMAYAATNTLRFYRPVLG